MITENELRRLIEIYAPYKSLRSTSGQLYRALLELKEHRRVKTEKQNNHPAIK